MAAVQAESAGISTLLVVVSGDVAYSGKKQQYRVASIFIDHLMAELRGIPGIQVLGPVLIPGNHDCNFESEGDVRPQLLGSLASRLETLDLDGQTVQQITQVQDEFFSFEKIYSTQDRQRRERLHYSHLFTIGNEKVVVHCINSAWVSRLKEQVGQLVFPAHFPINHGSELPSLVITVFHHPYPWLEVTNRREFRKLVESFSDIVLTGHEHDGDAYVRDSSMEEHVHYVEGAALQAAGVETGFNLIVVDTIERGYEVYRFLKTGRLYRSGSAKKTSFARNPSLLKQYFENRPEFKLTLRHLGGTFSHPVKKILEIDDVFVYPDLRTRGLLDKTDKLVSSQNVLDYVASQRFINVSGAPMSGKTTLGKKLYLDLQEP